MHPKNAEEMARSIAHEILRITTNNISITTENPSTPSAVSECYIVIANKLGIV